MNEKKKKVVTLLTWAISASPELELEAEGSVARLFVSDGAIVVNFPRGK